MDGRTTMALFGGVAALTVRRSGKGNADLFPGMSQSFGMVDLLRLVHVVYALGLLHRVFSTCTSCGQIVNYQNSR